MALRPLLRTVMAALLALPLAACGTGRQDPLVSTLQELTGGLFGGAESDTAPVFSAETVPPELLAQLPGPVMLIELPAVERSSGLTRVGQNGSDTTWRGPNGIGLTIDGNGVLISTRGFGSDLMSSDVRPTAAALDARESRAVNRAMIHLDGEAQQIRRIYDCTVSLDGPETVSIAGTSSRLTRMSERCTGADGYGFTNVYWLNASGRAVQSRQWVSPEMGHFRITLLRE